MPVKEVIPPTVPEDLNFAIKSGKVRAPTHIVSTICDDRGTSSLCMQSNSVWCYLGLLSIQQSDLIPLCECWAQLKFPVLNLVAQMCDSWLLDCHWLSSLAKGAYFNCTKVMTQTQSLEIGFHKSLFSVGEVHQEWCVRHEMWILSNQYMDCSRCQTCHSHS